MAERRMFAKSIINSARFLKMPSETQALYFHLGLQADDDGIVEAYNVLRTLGVGEDNLKLLVAKGFVQVLNEDLVSFILDWTEHNKIRPDRKVDSIYKNLLLQVLPDAPLIPSRERADTAKKKGLQVVDDQRTSNGQHRIGKDRLGEVRLGKDNKDTLSCSQDDVKEIISYLNCKTESSYKTSSKKTVSLITARLNDGFTVDDFKTVIDKKTAEWINDPKMNKFLRPETLFGTKFEGYLNQKTRSGFTQEGHAVEDYSGIIDF